MKQLELRQTPSDEHWSIWYKDAKENIPQNIFVPVLPKEDAELIVKAVNNHDLLVEALKENKKALVNCYNWLKNEHGNDELASEILPIFKKAQEILSKIPPVSSKEALSKAE